MSGNARKYLRRQPVDELSQAAIDRYVAARFPAWVPSPIKEVLWVKRLGGHLGARLILFDDVPCLLILPDTAAPETGERWIYRGLPATFDTRPFFFHRMRGAWMRADGTLEENLELHRWNCV
ncbi:MAG: hypothetical protein INR70_26585 [Parafilimonas terrae]|nr:hypothetical protein [Parafilimonas terrae]